MGLENMFVVSKRRQPNRLINESEGVIEEEKEEYLLPILNMPLRSNGIKTFDLTFKARERPIINKEEISDSDEKDYE
jgi:hypothetical protein